MAAYTFVATAGALQAVVEHAATCGFYGYLLYKQEEAAAAATKWFICKLAAISTMPRHGRTCIVFWSYMTLILLLIVPWVATIAASQNIDDNNDREALLCIKSHLSQSNITGALSTWNNSSDFCQWQGVLCSPRQSGVRRVAALELDGEGIIGQIPPCISNLTHLNRIHLPFNFLTGAMPPEMGQLSRLSYVNLSSNTLSGVIPAELSSCSSLQVIVLRNNSFYGGIPAFLFNSSLIQTIDLRMNHFDGPIPPFVPYYSTSSLEFLALTQNSLSGEIPPSLGNLSSLVYLLSAENQLTGGIPESFAKLSYMQFFDLSYNNLSGTVPNTIYNLSLLRYLGLGNNGFAGTLPSTMGTTLPNIQSLIMSVNNFEGEIPKSLSNATNLVKIYLAQNSLSGVIPSMGTLLSLQTVVLFENQRLEAGDWTFLSSLTNCTQLAVLILAVNNLQGNLPTSMTNLSINLEQLILSSNRITGTIPSGVGNLVGISVLYLDNNMLAGPVPASIGKLHKLNYLRLSENRFYGTIPTSLGNLDQLTELYLNENNFSGAIPVDLAGCKNLLSLNLSSNYLSGHIPNGLFEKLEQLNLFLDISNNQLTNSIPDEFGSLINLQSLNISNNMISGKIPSTLGSCVLLQALRLDNNLLEGEIPPSLGALKGIEEVDFSQNDLSGEIPEFFEQFSVLQYLNLSFNNLGGPIPTKGIFANITSSLFLQGNPRLCTDRPAIHIPLCSAEVSERKNGFNVKLLAILLPCISVALLLTLFLVIKRKNKDSSPLPDSSIELKNLSYNDLSKATNGFSSANLIGSGMSGLVYKGSLPEQNCQMVAVKVFKHGQSSSSESFVAECRALRNIRHRNLVKVITACSTYDPSGNEFKALVLEYMSNGTLEDHLHIKSHRYGYLSLGARISIAVDVAAVLEYLHIWSVPPMVHCDLKPSNIFFDENNVARVGDFGLSLFLHGLSSSKESLNSTSLIGARGSVGYIPPEYGMGSKMSTEGDIFSYGIILLEMLIGKRPTDELFNDGFTLHKYVEKALPQIGEILDPDLNIEIREAHKSQTQLLEQGNVTEVQRCILQLLNIGLKCSEEEPKHRPNIQDVHSEVVAVKEHFLSCIVQKEI